MLRDFYFLSTASSFGPLRLTHEDILSFWDKLSFTDAKPIPL